MNELVELQRQINKLKRRVADLETVEYAMAQNHGWVGAAWQKDPLRLGYSDVLRDTQSNTNLGAGTQTLDSGMVPAGEIWIVTNIVVKVTSTTISWLEVYAAGTTYTIFQQSTPTSGKPYDKQGYWILKPTEFVRLLVLNATAADDAYIYLVGHKVDIDQ